MILESRASTVTSGTRDDDWLDKAYNVGGDTKKIGRKSWKNWSHGSNLEVPVM